MTVWTSEEAARFARAITLDSLVRNLVSYTNETNGKNVWVDVRMLDDHSQLAPHSLTHTRRKDAVNVLVVFVHVKSISFQSWRQYLKKVNLPGKITGNQRRLDS